MSQKEGNEAIVNAYRISAEHWQMAKKKSFFQYALSIAQKASIVRYWKKGVAYFRRFRLVAVCLRIAAAILAVLQTGALVLLATAVFLVILPAFFALMLGILIAALLESHRTDRRILQKSNKKTVCVLFMPERASAFFKQNAKSLAASGDRIVLIVSPYLIFGGGLEQRQFYCTARRECENVYLVRRYYFFHLKKRVLPLQSTAFLY